MKGGKWPWESDTPENVGTPTTIQKPKQSMYEYFSSFGKKPDAVKPLIATGPDQKTGSDMVGGKRKSRKSKKSRKTKKSKKSKTSKAKK
jgi:hypothetical protein